MKRLHLVPEASEANGVFQVARMLAVRDGGELRDMDGVPYVVDGVAFKNPADWTRFATKEGVGHTIEWFDEVWVHGMWLPREWAACRMALRAGKRLVRMPHGSLSPIYLEKQGKWKKRLVSPIERHYFAKCDRIVVTGLWEEEWCRKWGLTRSCETIDLKQFFHLPNEISSQTLNLTLDGRQIYTCRPLHLLYFGRRHPLKGLDYLLSAIRQLDPNLKCENDKTGQTYFIISQSSSLQLKVVSNAFDEEKERIWDWCDILVLPTLSENFGLVIAEALERGKCAITTDGAPAWGDGNDYGGRLIYLKGYRDGSDEERVRLLKNAIEKMQMS